MKILTLTIAVLIIFVSCQDNKYQSIEITNTDISHVKPIGDQIAKDLVKSLQKELKTAIETGGFSEAVRVCNMEAIPISDIIATSSEKKIEIKRTTFKYRNPDNAPNEYETEALNYFKELIASGKTVPEYYLQKYSNGENAFFYYYKPMKVASKCLTCHGDETTITPETQQMINEFYPDDKAIGYAEGDFRGLIRIEISE